MPRTISSAQTFIMKWVFPAVWIGGFGLATCALWLGGFYGRNGLPPELLKWDFLVAWLVGSGFIIWFCGRLKRVQIDGDTLYVSNYSSEVRIPLTEISHFTQSYLSRPPTITVHLRSMSPVGQRIVFIPKFRWVLFGIFQGFPRTAWRKGQAQRVAHDREAFFEVEEAVSKASGRKR